MGGASVVLAAGYALAVPVTVVVPGFLRMWRRREPALYACAQGGAALVVLGWLLSDRPWSAAVNAAWLVGLHVAWVREGRLRASREQAGRVA